MNAQLSQSIQWTGDAGAYFDVLATDSGGNQLVVYPAGQSTSALLADVLSGITLPGDHIVNLHVRSKIDTQGNLPSAWSQPALQVTIVGFGVPSVPTLV